MSTPIIHILGAFIAVLFAARLLKKEMQIEYLLLLSFSAILPDLIDKSLTGSRFPFHSLLISGLILFLSNITVYYYMLKNPSLAKRVPLLNTFMILISIAIMTHPIMDLETSVPLFYPIDIRGYRLYFQVSVQQSLPPIFTNFKFGLVLEPFDYTMSYDREGNLLATLDVLFILIVVVLGLVTLIAKIIQYFYHFEKLNDFGYQ
ncbi:MAG: metal-dependent hydrolase [Candidatus Hodarchaeota archaeon]